MPKQTHTASAAFMGRCKRELGFTACGREAPTRSASQGLNFDRASPEVLWYPSSVICNFEGLRDTEA